LNREDGAGSPQKCGTRRWRAVPHQLHVQTTETPTRVPALSILPGTFLRIRTSLPSVALSDRVCGNSDRTTNRRQKNDRGTEQPGARQTLEIEQENASTNTPSSVCIGSNNTSLKFVGSFIVLLTG
jgi:hypothetical protein